MENNKRSEFILGISMLIFGLIYGVYALQIPGSEGIDSSMVPRTGLALLLLILANTTPMTSAVFLITTVLQYVPDITAQCH